MRKLAAFVGCLMLLSIAGVAVAGPLAPPLPGPAGAAGGEVAGEGAAPNACILGTVAGCGGNPAFRNPSAVQHLDWIVVNDGNPNGGFSYYYQLENSSVASVFALTIGSGAFQAAGFISGIDLDDGIPATSVITPGFPPASPLVIATAVTAHTAAGFTNLGAPGAIESELVDGGPIDPFVVAIVGGAHQTTWVTVVAVGDESSVLVGQGGAPAYFHWNTIGSSGGTVFTWDSQNGNCTGVDTPDLGCTGAGEQGRQVAAPGAVIPEPASLVLIGIGITALGIVTRRAARKQ